MPGQLEEIERINVKITEKEQRSASDQPWPDRNLEVRDRVVERIRHIAGKDSIKSIQPIQPHGDHQEQDISFDIGDVSYTATVRYNNALTEGWVATLRKYPKIC